MKSVLVTGASGALGQAVIKQLKKTDNYSVIAAIRNSDVELKVAVENPEENSGTLYLDVRDTVQLQNTITELQPDLVIHLAATFENDFDTAYAVNVESSRTLLESMLQSGCQGRVVLIGSAAEYGVIQPQENPVSEDHVLKPVSVYGLTKAWQTQLAGLYSCRGVDVVVARVFNLYGDKLSERLFIGRLQKQIDAVLEGKQTVIELGPLSASRDYLSTEEAAEQLLRIAHYGQSGSVYHVASGQAVSMRELLMKYLQKNNLDISIVRESAESSNRSGYDVPVIYADISRTRQLSG